MILLLTDAHPYPYPQEMSGNEKYAIAQASGLGDTLTIEGVQTIQGLHTVTIQFKTREAAQKAKELTGWEDWDPGMNVLEADYSPDDGYAVGTFICPSQPFELPDGTIAPGTEFAGYILMEDF